MSKVLRPIGQALTYAIFMALVGHFASAPAYSPIDPREAVVKLSVGHAGRHKYKCHQMTPEELAKLPPNMRWQEQCPRERLPVRVQMTLDGKVMFDKSVRPSGIWHDGPSYVYRTFTVKPGRHHLVVGLRDSARPEGFDYERSADIDLVAGRYFVVDFSSDAGGFIFE